MTENTETTEVTLPPLAASITDQLTGLAAHATVHGRHEERTGEESEEMPPCLADHVAALSSALFGLTKPEEHGCTIATTIEVPAGEIELPDGLIEGLQKVVRDLAEKLGKQS